MHESLKVNVVGVILDKYPAAGLNTAPEIWHKSSQLWSSMKLTQVQTNFSNKQFLRIYR